MPGLDYANDVPLSLGGVSLRELWGLPSARRFYDGSPGRELVPCPDCRQAADALFGDHGGQCIEATVVALPGTALGLIRKAALTMRHLSINDLRDEFDRAAVKGSARGPAFAAAVKKGWLEPEGSKPSTDGPTKGHHIGIYRSLIHPAAVAAVRAAR